MNFVTITSTVSFVAISSMCSKAIELISKEAMLEPGEQLMEEVPQPCEQPGERTTFESIWVTFDESAMAFRMSIGESHSIQRSRFVQRISHQVWKSWKDSEHNGEGHVENVKIDRSRDRRFEENFVRVRGKENELFRKHQWSWWILFSTCGDDFESSGDDHQLRVWTKVC